MRNLRRRSSTAANAVLVRQNWSIGKLIVEDEQKELYRLQMLDEKLPGPQRPIRAKKKGGAK